MYFVSLLTYSSNNFVLKFRLQVLKTLKKVHSDKVLFVELNEKKQRVRLDNFQTQYFVLKQIKVLYFLMEKLFTSKETSLLNERNSIMVM